MTAVTDRLEQLIEVGYNSRNEEDYNAWVRRTMSFLSATLSPYVNQFSDAATSLDPQGWSDMRASQLGLLEGLHEVDDGERG